MIAPIMHLLCGRRESLPIVDPTVGPANMLLEREDAMKSIYIEKIEREVADLCDFRHKKRVRYTFDLPVILFPVIRNEDDRGHVGKVGGCQ